MFPEEARDFLNTAAPRISPRGFFVEAAGEDLLGPEGAAGFGPRVIAGFVTLGPDEAGETAPEDINLWIALVRLTFQDSLDFLEYRIRQYLKPTGRAPGPRLIPGCPALAESYRPAILDFVQSRSGEELPAGELENSSRFLVFIYPTADYEAPINQRCAACSRRDCPARLESESDS